MTEGGGEKQGVGGLYVATVPGVKGVHSAYQAKLAPGILRDR